MTRSLKAVNISYLWWQRASGHEKKSGQQAEKKMQKKMQKKKGKQNQTQKEGTSSLTR